MTDGMTGSCHRDSIEWRISCGRTERGSVSIRYSRIRSAWARLLGSSGSTPSLRMAMSNAWAESITFLWL
jgi:hypothetical protein